MGWALGGRDVALVVGLCEQYWEVGRKTDASTCVADVLKRDPENARGRALRDRVRVAARSASAER
jgi:hypothetical protein